MDVKNVGIDITIPLDKQDRRVESQPELPYLTEEGMVLIDRREQKRRKNLKQKVPDKTSTEIPMFDTHITPDKM